MGGIKDAVKRDLVQWNDIAQKIWFSCNPPSTIRYQRGIDVRYHYSKDGRSSNSQR